MKSFSHIAAAVVVAAVALGNPLAQAAVTTVSSISPVFVPDQWYAYDVRPGGTATIVNLAAAGGNLQNNQPLPPGAAKLTTDFTDAAKAEVGYVHDFGTVNNILASLQVNYSYFKENVPGGNAAAAPSIKLSFLADAANPSPSGDGFVTLVYEPYWNLGNTNPPTGDWQSVNITATQGLFWQTGGFGLAATSGGPPDGTLTDLLGMFDSAFSTAHLVSIQVGVGTFNQGQVGYFDAVQVVAGAFDTTFDFGPAAAPEPASLGLWGIASFAAMGLVRLRRSKQNS